MKQKNNSHEKDDEEDEEDIDGDNDDDDDDDAQAKESEMKSEDKLPEDGNAVAASLTGWDKIKAQVSFIMDDDQWALANPTPFVLAMSNIAPAISTIVIFTSSMILCVESLPQFYEASTNQDPPWYPLESSFVSFFSLEFILRLWAAPRKLYFLRQAMNIMDVLSVLPYYIELIFGQLPTPVDLRILRLLRVNKILRYFPGIRIIFQAFHASKAILFLCFVVLLISLILWSAVMYSVEREFGWFDVKKGQWMRKRTWGMTVIEERSPFQSIFHTMWWTITTMCTVGYGDEVPVSWGGKVVAGVAMLSGIFVLSLPTSVVGSNFLMLYKQLNAGNFSTEQQKIEPTSIKLLSMVDVMVEEGILSQSEAYYVQRMMWDEAYLKRLHWVYDACVLAPDVVTKKRRLANSLRDLISYSEEQNLS
eukprot:PhF_6_TR14240/c1_g1_i1/m.22841